jgi:hypothetical protein
MLMLMLLVLLMLGFPSEIPMFDADRIQLFSITVVG